MQKWSPRNKKEARIASLLPKSVATRLGGGCKSLLEANVCLRLAESAAGSVGTLLAALYVYVVPVQAPGVSVFDILYLLDVIDAPVPAHKEVGDAGVPLRTWIRSLMKAEKGGLLYRPGKEKKPGNMTSLLPEVKSRSGRSLGDVPSKVALNMMVGEKQRLSYRLAEAIADGVVDDRVAFPVKGHIGAATKVNLFLSDVLKDIRQFKHDTWDFVAANLWLLCGAKNDCATAWCMWLSSTYQVLGKTGLHLARFWDSPKLKEVNELIKAVGVNSTVGGAVCCELNTMLGRGAVEPDAWADIRGRVERATFKRDKLASFPAADLERAIRAVVGEELATKPRWMDKEDYWSKRWMFTVAGSHSRGIEDVIWGERKDLPPNPTRREFSENVEENMVALGDPYVLAGISWKLEHGKTRAIYGCDSRSYFTFDYLLRPVEAVWRNKRAMLNPGLNLQGSLYPELAKKGPARYMLDFDDFNSQHSLEAMRLAVDIATEGAPEDVRSWARQSWDNIHYKWKDGDSMRVEKSVGTLPSGHRATTFINTILNAAYCRLTMGACYERLDGRHAGDDVVMSGSSSDIDLAIAGVMASPLRVNRSKQSVGSVSGEFLRVAYGPKDARGYVARAISSAVSGNWVTELAMSKRSQIDNYARMGWTLALRSGDNLAGAMLKSSLARRVPEMSGCALRVVTNQLSINGSATAANDAFRMKMLLLDGGLQRKADESAGRGSLATDAFFAKHVDFKVLREAGIDPGVLRRRMLEASYKPRSIKFESVVESTEVDCPATTKIGMGGATFFPYRGMRTVPAAIRLLESLFREIDWRKTVAAIRGTDYSSLSVTGKMEWPISNARSATYADLASLRNRFTRPTMLVVNYPVRV